MGEKRPTGKYSFFKSRTIWKTKWKFSHFGFFCDQTGKEKGEKKKIEFIYEAIIIILNS
jgi:hypothetical protein